jgi:HAD superfamily hydrolase (TIGR01509 family)
MSAKFSDSGIKAIFFDQNGVLTTRSDEAVQKAQAGSRFNGYAARATSDALYCGHIDEDEYAAQYVAQLAAAHASGEWTEELALEAHAQCLKVLAACRETLPIDGMVGFAVEAAKRGYIIGIISNTWANGQREETLSVIQAPFPRDLIVQSHEVHLAKPDAAIYLEAARRAGVDPSCCLFLDDTAKHAEGATKAGFKEHIIIRTADVDQITELSARL